MGATTGETSGAQPLAGVTLQKTGLSARRFRFEPRATKPRRDPTAVVGTTPPNTSGAKGTAVQPLPLYAQAPGASVGRSHPNRTAVDPSEATLANPKVRGSRAATSLQLTPPF